MKADPEDKIFTERDGRKLPPTYLLVALAVLALLAWVIFSGTDEPAPEPEVEVPVSVPVVEPELPPAPDIPEPRAPEPETAPMEAPEPEVTEPPLPPLDQSDAALREQLEGINADARFEKLLRNDNLIPRGVTAIHGLSRGLVVKKAIPLDPPVGAFKVITSGEAMYLDPEGYNRYDTTALAISSLDTELMVSTFHRFRPLFEQAYAELGQDPEDFDNAVIRALDIVLATEEVSGDIALERKSVMYTFADPVLEQLPPLQKQLLRMGPENMRLIKQQAQALRAGLLEQR